MAKTSFQISQPTHLHSTMLMPPLHNQNLRFLKKQIILDRTSISRFQLEDCQKVSSPFPVTRLYSHVYSSKPTNLVK